MRSSPMQHPLSRALALALAVCLCAAARVLAADAKAEFVGAETCSGCHSEQSAAFKSSTHGKKIPVVKNMSADKACESCHGPGSLHAAAGGDKNDPGFKTIGKVSVDQCLTCHKGGETMFWGVGAHAQADMDCNSCHSVHKGKGAANLKADPTETCLKCHPKQRAEGSLPSHHPVKEGNMTCGSCHNPHGGESGNLRAETANELCFKCHADKAGPFVHEHPPVTEDCSNCHIPHGSQNSKLLKRKEPMLCMQCHIQPHWDNAATQPVKRAYYVCTKCHNEVHGSDRKARFLPR